jgi:dihydroneopterin aldolase
MSLTATLTQLQPEATAMPRRTVFLKGLRLEAHIGAYEHERGRTQPVIIDIEMEVIEPSDPVSDKLEDVVCYNKLSQNIQAILDEGHIQLVETLAERIAAMCLAHPMGLAVRVRVDKPNALSHADGAGVEIIRLKKEA